MAHSGSNQIDRLPHLEPSLDTLSGLTYLPTMATWWGKSKKSEPRMVYDFLTGSMVPAGSRPASGRPKSDDSYLDEWARREDEIQRELERHDWGHSDRP